MESRRINIPKSLKLDQLGNLLKTSSEMFFVTSTSVTHLSKPSQNSTQMVNLYRLRTYSQKTTFFRRTH